MLALWRTLAKAMVLGGIWVVGAPVVVAQKPAPAKKPPAARTTTKVTAVRFQIIPANYTGPCPGKLRQVGTISTNGPGTVWYRFEGGGNFEFPEGQEGTIIFRGAGTRTVTKEVTSMQGVSGSSKRGPIYFEAAMETGAGKHGGTVSAQTAFSVKCSGGSGKGGPTQGKGRVTTVRLRAQPPRWMGRCPGKLRFPAMITTNGPAEVKYTWVSFDGGTWPEGTVTFTGAGTKEVSQPWELGGAGQVTHGWMQLKVLSPNSLVSAKAGFVVRCK